uniref:Uncharacterized protein n=1 Tax=Candidatus Giovannonibacteria bacterium GW2011_GWF2_42_19 TaxID=1618659 RepID=A0A0G1BRU2_9BACT|nr:MAG: hypothetical protein UV11_C0001G0071 [Candidatus Giovannonibacteria bacterium GW2011_GWF2_42_19]
MNKRNAALAILIPAFLALGLLTLYMSYGISEGAPHFVYTLF